MNAQALQGLLTVARVLDDLGVRWKFGGSAAGTCAAESGSTLNVDLAAAVKMEHVAPLCAELSRQYYADPAAALQAVLHHGYFNLIHLESMLKVNIYVVSPQSIPEQDLDGSMPLPLEEESAEALPSFTPEDKVLHRLAWYRTGGEVSSGQWVDIVAILRTQGKELDRAYMETTAQELGVADLLGRAFRAAATPRSRG